MPASPNGNHEHMLEDVLFSLPLIIACSIEVECPDEPFKPEYVIPQIVMLALVNHERFQGCSFTSTKKISGFEWTDDLLCNIAIPVRSISEKGFCPKLTECFIVSDSISYKYEVLKCKIAPVRDINNAVIDEILVIGRKKELTAHEDYEGSIFGQLEQLLVDSYMSHQNNHF